jgi:hypothetical protein
MLGTPNSCSFMGKLMIQGNFLNFFNDGIIVC